MSVFTILQAFIRVLRRVRNFVVISGTKESLRDDGRSVLTEFTGKNPETHKRLLHMMMFIIISNFVIFIFEKSLFHGELFGGCPIEHGWLSDINHIMQFSYLFCIVIFLSYFDTDTPGPHHCDRGLSNCPLQGRVSHKTLYPRAPYLYKVCALI